MPFLMGPLHDLWSTWVLSHLHGDLPLKSGRAELPWGWLYMLRLRGVFSPSKSSTLSSLSEAVIPKAGQMKRLQSHSTNYSDLSLSTKRNKKPTAGAIFSVAMKTIWSLHVSSRDEHLEWAACKQPDLTEGGKHHRPPQGSPRRSASQSAKGLELASL